MKTIHKRLYTVLPRPAVVAASSASTSRVRSNSASSSRSFYSASQLSFLDASQPPPPPSTRGNSNVVIGRVAAEVRAEIESHSTNPSSQQHPGTFQYPFISTLGHAESSPHLPLSPYNPFLQYQSLSPLFVYTAKSQEAPAPDHRKKRQRIRYHLDVGAYGIPKRSRGPVVAGRDGHGRFDVRAESHSSELNRAVQVGEDAYFVRDNAMGVADGVGGWSRHRRTGNSADPTPSALFARRLMHYCSEEVDAAAAEPSEQALPDADLYSEADDDIYAELEDSLEELEDGLDVLMILERAYEKALKSHVCRADQSTAPSGSSRSPSPSDSLPEHAASASSSHAATRRSHTPPPAPAVVPLCEGSSTALVAILEHPSSRPSKSLGDAALFNPQPVSGKPGQPEVSTDGAVIRIAHLGDCMGMLIRGEEIVWRTEEMWWNFNTPVQLGPTSSTKPHDARIFTIPVQEDDILILASDGLSDNLWDTDILDEVVRFRRSFMGPTASVESDSAESLPSDKDVSAKGATTQFRRSTLAGMLSEALCSRAKRVSETRGSAKRSPAPSSAPEGAVAGARASPVSSSLSERDVPFARRAKEQGKLFDGGKPDDISVLVAVISPVEP